MVALLDKHFVSKLRNVCARVQLAKGQPPRCNVSSFRLLFMIVRDGPPSVEGAFSNEFKDFVWHCLKKVWGLAPMFRLCCSVRDE